LVKHGYSSIDESSKVCILLKGITRLHYDVLKANILTSLALKTSFATSVELYKDFIKELNTDSPRNVSDMQTRSQGGGGGAISMTAEGAHLIPKEAPLAMTRKISSTLLITTIIILPT
jgi:hypothetical protein